MSNVTVEVMNPERQETAQHKGEESTNDLLKLYKSLKREVIELEGQVYNQKRSQTFEKFESAHRGFNYNFNRTYKSELLTKLKLFLAYGLTFRSKDNYLFVDLQAQLQGKHCATYSMTIGNRENKFFIKSVCLPPGINAHSIIKRIRGADFSLTQNFVQKILLYCQIFHSRKQEYLDLQEYIKAVGVKIRTISPAHRQWVTLHSGFGFDIPKENTKHHPITLTYGVKRYRPSSVEWTRNGENPMEEEIISHCIRELYELSLVEALKKLIPQDWRSSGSVFLKLLSSNNSAEDNSSEDENREPDLDKMILKPSHNLPTTSSLNDEASVDQRDKNNSRDLLSKEKTVPRTKEMQPIHRDKRKNVITNHFMPSKTRESEQNATSSKSHQLGSNFGQEGPEKMTVDRRANTSNKSYDTSLLIKHGTQNDKSNESSETSKSVKRQISKMPNRTEQREGHESGKLDSRASLKNGGAEKEEAEEYSLFSIAKRPQARKAQVRASPTQVQHKRSKNQQVTLPPLLPPDRNAESEVVKDKSPTLSPQKFHREFQEVASPRRNDRRKRKDRSPESEVVKNKSPTLSPHKDSRNRKGRVPATPPSPHNDSSVSEEEARGAEEASPKITSPPSPQRVLRRRKVQKATLESSDEKEGDMLHHASTRKSQRQKKGQEATSAKGGRRKIQDVASDSPHKQQARKMIKRTKPLQVPTRIRHFRK